MNLRPERKRALDESLMDALLHELYDASTDGRERRITRLISRIDDSPSTIDKRHARASPSRRMLVSVTVSAAAILLLATIISLYGPAHAAQSIVDRSLRAKLPVREYRLTMTHQLPWWGEREITSEFFVDDEERFVLRHPRWRRGSLWIGGDREHRWLIPPSGPAIVGGESLVGGWLSRRDIPSRYLDLTTILERLRRGYRLRKLAEERPPQEFALEVPICAHIVGRARRTGRDRPQMPSRIDLWSAEGNGIVHRLQLSWTRSPGERGPISWTIEFVGTPDLPRDWFQVESHLEPGRRIIQATKEQDLAVLGQ